VNLYKLHDSPKALSHHDIAHLHVPIVLKDKILHDLKMGHRSRYTAYTDAELKLLVKDPATAYWLANLDSMNTVSLIPKSMVPALERTIAAHSDYAYYYAENLHGVPWPKITDDKATVELAEKNIASNANTAFYYSTAVLKAPWPPGEKAIMASGHAEDYELFLAGETDHLWTADS
jgi:hypothetical protein